jgi:hypothetical protein
MAESLKNCSTEDNLEEMKSSPVFNTSMNVIDLIFNSSVPWEEIDSVSRSKSLFSFLDFIQSEISKEEHLLVEDRNYFESQNIISEFSKVLADVNQTFQFPFNCEDECSETTVELRPEDEEIFVAIFQSEQIVKSIFRQEGGYSIISPVFLVNLFKASSNDSGSNNVTLQLLNFEERNVSMSRAVCLKWKETVFSTEGCLTVSRGSNNVTCQCQGPGVFAAGRSTQETLTWKGSFGVFYLNFVFFAISIIILLGCLVIIIWKKL